MSLTLTSSRGTTRSPSRGVRLVAALLAAASSPASSPSASRVRSAATPPPLPERTRPTRPRSSPSSSSASRPTPTTPTPGNDWRRSTSRARLAAATAPSCCRRSTPSSEAIRLRPDDIATYHAHGALQLTLHQFAAAREVGLAAHASHPDSPDALAILVDSSIELGRYDDADAYLGQLLDLRPNASALARVSYLREIRGDLPGARVAMSQAATAASGNTSESATITTLVGDLALAGRRPPGRARGIPTGGRHGATALVDRARHRRERLPRSAGPMRRSGPW